mmetsp:Transcript_7492/g.8435  ORF Transcript_7492/g.8435 Transcript_7492/m.8435 type:complete len:240 (+) Transcript_7492:779-1498(+)
METVRLRSEAKTSPIATLRRVIRITIEVRIRAMIETGNETIIALRSKRIIEMIDHETGIGIQRIGTTETATGITLREITALGLIQTRVVEAPTAISSPETTVIVIEGMIITETEGPRQADMTKDIMAAIKTETGLAKEDHITTDPMELAEEAVQDPILNLVQGRIPIGTGDLTLARGTTGILRETGAIEMIDTAQGQGITGSRTIAGGQIHLTEAPATEMTTRKHSTLPQIPLLRQLRV